MNASEIHQMKALLRTRLTSENGGQVLRQLTARALAEPNPTRAMGFLMTFAFAALRCPAVDFDLLAYSLMETLDQALENADAEQSS